MNYYCSKCKEYFKPPYYCIHYYHPEAPSLKGIKMPEKLTSDKIQEFIDWLEENTDFGEWDEKLKIEIHKKLIEFITQN